MALNYPGPYEVRYIYQCTATPGGELEHQTRLSLALEADPDVGTLFADIDVTPRVAAPVDLQTVCNAFVQLVIDVYETGNSMWDRVELWKYTPDTFLATYISQLGLAEDGDAVGSVVPAAQSIFTYRTEEGGIMKVTLMEPSHTPMVKQVYGDLNPPEDAIVDWFLDDAASFHLARDTSYPTAFLGWFPGQNEHVFKKRFRA
jgi:hypothetical protein